MNVYAGAFLIPVGVMFYTAHGGLKATYIASWSHVAMIYIALCTFAFLIYAAPPSSTPLGSISKVGGWGGWVGKGGASGSGWLCVGYLGPGCIPASCWVSTALGIGRQA